MDGELYIVMTSQSMESSITGEPLQFKSEKSENIIVYSGTLVASGLAVYKSNTNWFYKTKNRTIRTVSS
jgi:Ca2+-transporting ATPase